MTNLDLKDGNGRNQRLEVTSESTPTGLEVVCRYRPGWDGMVEVVKRRGFEG